ncbi:MAG: shikimate dehydrogenase [Akkermansiaceae bacterium]|nr:shikimate dehydrogenase [Akkermansiaceae bacterium]
MPTKDVYTLNDLADGILQQEDADKPARLAVIGWPVAHSASPQLHQPALDALDINCRYIRIEVPEGRVVEAFDLMREQRFIGCNATVPHKFAALAYCDEVDPAAQALGSVNTLRFDKDASRGFNTDGVGFAKAIEENFGSSLEGLKVVITGAAGGAGQALTSHCLRSGVRKLVLVNRSQGKLDMLVKHLNPDEQDAEIIPLSFDSPELAQHCLDSQLIVNTSSVGLKPDDPSILPAECLKPEHWVYDAIYEPAETPLLKLAKQEGAKTANGMSMLIHQGAFAFQHWFPDTEPLPHMQQALGN